MKIIKKLFLLTLLISIIFNLSSILIYAVSNHIENIKLIEEEQMTDNVMYQYYKMDTSFNANDTKLERNVYTYTLKQTSYAHLATWTMSNPDDYTRVDLKTIAEDYEKNHPGWVVLGGVNAEGYYNDELTNAFIQDGDVIRKDVSAEAFKKLIGFKEDGSVVIKQVPKASEYPLLKIDDLNYDVTKVNELPEENGISVITKDLKGSLNVNGYSVIELTYTLFRKSEQFPNPNKTHSGPFLGIFLKGYVNGKVELNSISNSNCNNRKFYIVTKNNDVVTKLVTNKQIKIEFDYVDEFKDVVSMTGYMYQYLKNGKTIPVNYVETNDVGEPVNYNCDYYKSTSKERCGIGFKEDGSIVLLTTNTNRVGPTQFEVGEMFKQLGCIDAYQFDGGGSVTFLKRNDKGEIEMLNTPGDGNPRSIMSGLFVVARDTQYEISPIEITNNSITLDVNVLQYSREGNVSNTYVNLYGKTKSGKEFDELVEVKNGKVKFENLDSNNKYYCTIKYKLENNEELIDSFVSNEVITAKKQPSIRKLDITKVNNILELNLSVQDDDKSIVGFMKISFDNGKTWNNILPGITLKLENFESDILNNIIIEYKYDINDGSDRKKVIDDNFKINYNFIALFDSLLKNNNDFIKSIFHNS